MRVRQLFIILCVLAVSGMMTACAKKPRPYLLEAPPPFVRSDSPPAHEVKCTPRDLNPLVASGAYIHKVDNFHVILDSSSTMSERQESDEIGGRNKLPLARDILKCMNQTIPDLQLTAGLRSFGSYTPEQGLLYGPEKYTREGFENGVDTVMTTGGLSPIANAVTNAGVDLQPLSGPTAVILVSDGMNTAEADPAAAARALKEDYPGELCIYTIEMGDSPEGGKVLEAVAEAGECGFTTADVDFSSATLADGSVLGNPEAMAEFVKRVFLAPVPDSDGDGVYDRDDKCPNTPAGVAVDKDGCPLDSDGDGVYDYLDKCPDTPRGIKVDSSGCPVPIPERLTKTLKVQFDFDKAVIRPEYHDHLEEVANFFKAYPDTEAELQGHTCSIGTEEYNLRLSQKRAESVKNYLVNKFGIAAKRLTAKGYGESRPIASNDTKSGREKNRRVVADIVTIIMKRPMK